MTIKADEVLDLIEAAEKAERLEAALEAAIRERDAARGVFEKSRASTSKLREDFEILRWRVQE